MPHHSTTDPLEGADAAATVVARARLAVHLRAREKNFDYIIADAPGTASALSRAAHEIADILITPINDSLIDIDVLARIDWDRRVVLKPSVYSQFVAECRLRNSDARRPFRWIVLRNRVSALQSRNKRDIDALMGLLAEHIGFQAVAGFGERVVYRELFPRGLTVLDADDAVSMEPSSHRAARIEVSNLLAAMSVPEQVAA
jgi:chromosome partitioning protein